MAPDELRTLRKSLGWSQATTAGRLGVQLRTYKHYEAGTTSRGRILNQVPRAIALAMLAQRFIRETEAETGQPMAADDPADADAATENDDDA